MKGMHHAMHDVYGDNDRAKKNAEAPLSAYFNRAASAVMEVGQPSG